MHKFRDKIPQIIEAAGETFMTQELEEYMNAKDDATAVEELADLLKVVQALKG